MPTLKQRMAVNHLLENPGKPIGQALEKAGYGPSMVKNPQDITRSKGWKELMDEYLGDDLLAEVHHGLLTDPSYKARSSGLDMAYKIKGSYAPVKAVTANVNVELNEIEADSIRLKYEEEMRLKLETNVRTDIPHRLD